MPYQLEISREAENDLRWMDSHGQRSQAVLARRSLERFLRDEPALEAGARERMRPNALGAGWALHLGTLRVYYDIHELENTVVVIRVGNKPGNTLYLRGRPFDLG